MSNGDPPSNRHVELRKYPNRRYYDTTRSQYVTLEAIHTAIRDGYEVHVTDSKSGDDITAKVLAQIILEHDSPKLDIFPVALLHQLIRANEPLIHDFVDKYFSRALTAFLDSQRQFDQYLRQALGLHTPMPMAEDWARLMMGPFAQGLFALGAKPDADGAVAESGSVSAANDRELRQLVQDLKREVEALRGQLDHH